MAPSFWLCTVDNSGSATTVEGLESEATTVKPEEILQTVTFDVRGTRVKVPLRLLHNAGHSTLLEELVQPPQQQDCIFVDANPERFWYILDWYRYGHVHLPPTIPVPAFLDDAEYFRLPDRITVNGTMLPLPSLGHRDAPTHHCDAPTLAHKACSAITDDWPQFEDFLNKVIGMVGQELDDRARKARLATRDVAGEEAPFISRLTLSTPTGNSPDEHRWKDEGNVCSQERLDVVVSALRARGFTCRVDRMRKRKNGTIKPLELIVGLEGGIYVSKKVSWSDTSTAYTVTPDTSSAASQW